MYLQQKFRLQGEEYFANVIDSGKLMYPPPRCRSENLLQLDYINSSHVFDM